MEGESGTDTALRVFAYAVYEKAPLYVAVIDALMEAKERFQLQLRPAEVARALEEVTAEREHVTAEEVADALEALFGWGNVSRFYDPAAPATLDQFYAKRFLYQLTEAGVAAHEGIRAVRRVGLDTGRLSGVLLPAIAEGLKAVDTEAGAEPAPDPARLYNSFVSLFASFAELADNAARYMDTLSVEMSIITTDDQSFMAYKRAVFAYLDEFVARLSQQVPEIEAVITHLDPHIAELIDIAATADQAPVLTGQDDGVRRSLTDRWSGIRAWFVSESDAPSIADSLRLAMVDAINRILSALDRLHERHVRRVSREADFMQLARWLAGMDDHDAAALWDQAFGLWSARHFAESAGDEELHRHLSFWAAPPAEVAPRLRTSGARAAPGRPAKAPSYAVAKQAGLAAVRQAHRQAEEALARLAVRSPIRLSDLGRLDPHEFSSLLTVIDAALAAPPDRHGTRTASSALVAVRLRPLSEKTTAEVVTPSGTLRCDDCVLDIELTGRSVRREQAG